jgi:hypothetical protein
MFLKRGGKGTEVGGNVEDWEKEIETTDVLVLTKPNLLFSTCVLETEAIVQAAAKLILYNPLAKHTICYPKEERI